MLGLSINLITHLLQFVLMWLNALSVKAGVSMQWSLRKLISWYKINVTKHCQTLLYSYYKVHDELEKTNSIQSLTHKAIVMDPIGNLQGLNKFLCKEMGK